MNYNPLSSAVTLKGVNTEWGVPIFRQSSRSFCVNDSSYKTANMLHKCMFVLLLGLSPSVGSFLRAGWPRSFLWYVKLSQMMSFLLLTCGRPYVSRSSLQFLSGHVTLSLCRDDSLTFTGLSFLRWSSLCSVAFYQDFIAFLKVVKFTNELDHHTAGDEAEDFWIALGTERRWWSGCSFIDGEVRGQMHTSRCLRALKNQSCRQWWWDPCTSAHFKSAVELVFGNTSKLAMPPKSCPLMKTLFWNTASDQVF